MVDKNLEEAKALFNEGIKFLKKENLDSAETKFKQSLNLSPGRLSIIHNLISIYIKTQQNDKLNLLLEKNENLSKEKEILYGKAFSFYFENKYEQSINICKKIIQFDQFKFSIQDLLASNFKQQKKFLEALKVYKQQLKENRTHLIFYNIGCLFLDLGRTSIAHYYFDKCREIKNDDFTNLNNLSLCKLKLKDLKNGFLLYESRFKKEIDPVKKKFVNIKSPKSLNETKDKKILVWDEQGLGDTIQFSRFVIDLLKFTKNITFAVNTKLIKIFEKIDENIKVCDSNNINDDNFDYQIPICSLPYFLNIEKLDDIKFYKLNINLDKSTEKIIDQKKCNIGISFDGNRKYFLDKYRSIPIKNFKNILNIENINFYKLSKGSSEQSEKIKSYPNLFDLGERSFHEISNYMAKLDLVISSDTSIIHLAGILNIRSILLLNYNSDWRWFDDNKSTIWYPSIKILKQKKFDDWSNVFSELEDFLKNFLLDKKKGQ